MSSIIDNREGNTLLNSLQKMGAGGSELSIATAFFSLDALMMLADSLESFDRIRILFGDDADAKQRSRLLVLLRERSDEDLLAQRENLPNLTPLKKIEALFKAGKVEARCYTAKKFHAKAYLIERPGVYPNQVAALGSGNFTRFGLIQNIELNVVLNQDQIINLSAWYEERWAEAVNDVVTEDLLKEVRRQIELYDPHVLYLKALYLWGKAQEAESPNAVSTKLLEALDPHQEQGFRRALKILQTQHGVMICDGVGLGKSYIALALMEYYLKEGKRVLLISPKSILVSSWKGYLQNYLSRFRKPFPSIDEVPMTDFGFDYFGDDDEETPDKLQEKRQLIAGFYERADVVVIDESHNFRTSAAARYKTLLEVVKPYRSRKKVILLTATPINTQYRDIVNQLALITHDQGNIGGYGIDQIKRYATSLDKDLPIENTDGQLALGLVDTPNEALNKVLESVVIQRSRATVKALATAAGKSVHFPRRSAPQCIQVRIGAEGAKYRELIALADKRFRPGVEFLKLMRAEISKAEKTGKPISPVKLMRGADKGIKLAAFLTEQYRRVPASAKKMYMDEVHLAALVYANTLKQLESSPCAFQGILQSLGMGLVARLQHVFGDEARPQVAIHENWIRTPLFTSGDADGNGEDDAVVIDEPNPDIETDGDAIDVRGDEGDEWLMQAVKSRGLAKKLREFDRDAFDIERWRNDIVSDLEFLKEIHAATLEARKQPDPKLTEALPHLKRLLAEGKKILIFTQSQRTAVYLERQFRTRLKEANTARIDSHVEKTRSAILHSFCPAYNAPARAESIPAKLDILVSTDVLSEGVNLQEAGAVISYDIHWNPVRLIQRIGRVDRRLDPKLSNLDHAFDIINLLPPDEINDIINLVGAVENRTLRISQALGIDSSFFKSDDPAGNLKEFNALYEGDVPSSELALNAYAQLAVEPPDERTRRMLDMLPPGAFGVWKNAPQEGLFVLYTMEATPKATAADLERFSAILGRPVLLLERPGKEPEKDAGEILKALAQTTPGESSGLPSDEAQLAQRLKKLKEIARRQFSEIGLPISILPKLVCWIELRKEKFEGNA